MMVFGGNDEIAEFILNGKQRFFTTATIIEDSGKNWKHAEVYFVVKELLFQNKIELVGKDSNSCGVYEVLK